MNRRFVLVVAVFVAVFVLLGGERLDAAGEDNYYKLGPDSLEQEGVPRGKLTGPHTLPCEVFPGTQHTYWVYVPAQYDAAKPAALMIFNDGQAFKNPEGDVRATNVIDNLTYRREIPVMITVFINPGRRPDQPEPTPRDWGDRNTNRPTEYNSLDDRYARVICDELLPALKKDYNISDDPEHRGIGGASSGAIAAFTVAWERPRAISQGDQLCGELCEPARRARVSREGGRERAEADPRVLSGRAKRQPRAAARRQLRSVARLVLSQRAAGRRR